LHSVFIELTKNVKEQFTKQNKTIVEENVLTRCALRSRNYQNERGKMKGLTPT
jgi:hypothetical protein